MPAVVPEPDATPLVRLLTRTIRSSLSQRPGQFSASSGAPAVVVVKSATDSQAATVELTADAIHVVSGARPDATAVLTVDLTRRLAITESSTQASADDSADNSGGLGDVVARVSALLNPPLPPWDEAAREFWASTCDDPGMPRALVVQKTNGTEDDAAGKDDEVLELGTGLPCYVVRGSADALAGLFTGADSFLDEVYAGNLKVRGTLPQLSVMAGASFKVRFHV